MKALNSQQIFLPERFSILPSEDFPKRKKNILTGSSRTLFLHYGYLVVEILLQIFTFLFYFRSCSSVTVNDHETKH